MSTQTGWHKTRLGKVPLQCSEAEPTRWDLLLDKLGMSEAEAIAQIDSHPILHSWRKAHYRNRFMPERALTRRQLEKLQ